MADAGDGACAAYCCLLSRRGSDQYSRIGCTSRIFGDPERARRYDPASVFQVKQLRLRMDNMGQLRLEHRGEGTVTAADIIPPPEVEIINTDLYLFTVDAPSAHLEIEFEVRAGRGYSPAEDRGRLPIGELPLMRFSARSAA